MIAFGKGEHPLGSRAQVDVALTGVVLCAASSDRNQMKPGGRPDVGQHQGKHARSRKGNVEVVSDDAKSLRRREAPRYR